MSGGCSAPHEWASPCAIRLIASSTLVRTDGSKVRTLNVNSARSEMMFSFVPARTVPTVTTAASVTAMLPRHDGLELHDRRHGHDDRVDGLLRR